MCSHLLADDQSESIHGFAIAYDEAGWVLPAFKASSYKEAEFLFAGSDLRHYRVARRIFFAFRSGVFI
jgi:hypothetical protein